ncbi:MAG: riboflavin biosynthesis protein RibF [Candidatus Omnitrophota bacterium]|nr:riboflavin biosynthesis protein RibF [Candidatus Omnitrophota bacterium]
MSNNMIIIHGINKIRKFRKPVLAIGVFDGVHRGHEKILRAVANKAERIGGTAMAMTFWPHPQDAGHLYSLEHRLRLIAGCGIKVCVVVGFNKRFAATSAEYFIKRILADLIRPAYVYVGGNFNFGRGGRGDYRMLEELAGAYRFGVKVFGVLKAGGRPVSSTHIRALIRGGKLFAASSLLGRPVSVLGTVVRGRALGSKLGFPTANINPHHEIIPPSGVYAVQVFIGDKIYRGVCNIGRKPTFNPQENFCPRQESREDIEVYIFDFKKNIYGRYIEVRFIKRIRNEKKYASIPQLAAQIKRDAIAARRLFCPH